VTTCGFGDLKAKLQEFDNVERRGNNMRQLCATIQALGRGLKEGETRGNLARRARLMGTKKNATLPVILQMMLDATAGSMDDASAPPTKKKKADNK
jgi:hypothetical protein